MVIIKFNKIKIVAESDEQTFSRTVSFKKGVNLIYGDNGTGKSTLLNSIIYALGLERIIEVALSNNRFIFSEALLDNLDYNKTNYQIHNSYVKLEIENRQKNVITIQRWIKSKENIDNNLIRLFKTSLKETETDPHLHKDFYVHKPYSYTSPYGFPRILNKFLGIELPNVPKRNKKSLTDLNPLYLDCIFSFLFIEQRRGWASIGNNIPYIYGIKDVKKYTLSYLLDLDLINNEKERWKLDNQKNDLEEKWRELNSNIKHISKIMNGQVINLHDNIPKNLNLSDYPYLAVSRDNKLVKIEDYIILLREDLLNIEEITFEKKEYSKYRKDLERKSFKLFELKERRHRLNRDLFDLSVSLKDLSNRLKNLGEDIRKNRDINRLKEMGSDIEGFPEFKDCPYCGKKINEVLVKTDFDEPPLSIDDNIAFLEQQRSSTKLLIKKIEKENELINNQTTSISTEIKETEEEIRNINNILLEAVKIPDTTNLKKRLILQDKINTLESLVAEFDKELDKIKNLIEMYNDIDEKYKKIPDDLYSITDIKKKKALLTKFTQNLEIFKFRSKFNLNVELSDDDLLPIVLGFRDPDISTKEFRFSASDQVRSIWAYIISLIQISLEFSTNHFGCCFFDEPKQQNVDSDDLYEFYKIVNSLNTEDVQIIITTSNKEENLKKVFNFANVSIFNIVDHLLIPENSTKSSKS